MSSTNNLPPSQTAKLSANHDPGWNDPPPLTYNIQSPQLPKPRNILNKRVAYPLSGIHSPNVPLPNLPPASNIAPQSVPIVALEGPRIPPTLLQTQELDINSEKLVNEVKAILLEFLSISEELGSKANDIKKRIYVMEQMWNSGSLNTIVQLKMRDLAYALRDSQPVLADEIHKALMVEHTSTVASWMPGIRHLIHHCIARHELLSIDDDDS